jgi:hypothetical protein
MLARPDAEYISNQTCPLHSLPNNTSSLELTKHAIVDRTPGSDLSSLVFVALYLKEIIIQTLGEFDQGDQMHLVFVE